MEKENWIKWLQARIPALKESHNEFWLAQALDGYLESKQNQALSMSGVSPRFSDVEIEDEANDKMFVSEDDLTQSETYREGFVDGATWMQKAYLNEG